MGERAHAATESERQHHFGSPTSPPRPHTARITFQRSSQPALHTNLVYAPRQPVLQAPSGRALAARLEPGRCRRPARTPTKSSSGLRTAATCGCVCRHFRQRAADLARRTSERLRLTLHPALALLPSRPRDPGPHLLPPVLPRAQFRQTLGVGAFKSVYKAYDEEEAPHPPCALALTGLAAPGGSGYAAVAALRPGGWRGAGRCSRGGGGRRGRAHQPLCILPPPAGAARRLRDWLPRARRASRWRGAR